MKILRFTIIVASISLISKIAGFIREAIIANELGISETADAVYIALTIPNIFQFVIGAAVASALIPALMREKKPLLLFSNIVNILVVAFLIISTFIYLLSDEIIFILAPDLGKEASETASSLLKMLIPASLMIGLGTVFKQVLQSEEKIIMANISQLLLNLAVILSMLTLAPFFSSVQTFAIGMLAGSILMVLVQYFSLYPKYKITRFKPTENIKEVYLTAVTIMMGLMVNQLFNITNRIIASTLEAGSISSLNYAERIVQLPLGIIAQSLAIVIFPFLAKYVAKGEKRNLENLLGESIAIILLVALPLSTYLWLYSEEIVSILFGRGEFGPEAIDYTSSALTMFSFMLLAQSLMMILTRFYYAIQKPRIPLYTIIITVLLNLGLAMILKDFIGHNGIALSNTIAMTINAFLLIILLTKYEIALKNIFSLENVKILLSTLIFFIGSTILNEYITISNSIFELFIKSSIGIILYFTLLLLLKEQMTVRLFNKILGK